MTHGTFGLLRMSIQELSLIDLLLFLVFVCVVSITINAFIYPPISLLDFHTYLVAAKLATRQALVYPHFYVPSSFTYPPSIFLFIFPFLLIPSLLAAGIWNTLSLVAM